MTIFNINNQFDNELNLNPPDPNKEYWISPLIQDKGLTLLMKIILICGNHPEFLNEISYNPDKYKNEIDKQTEKGCTALMIACRNCKTKSSEEAIRLLLKLGANTDLLDRNRGTALMIACRYCKTESSEEAIRLLIQAKANVDLQTIEGWTSLMMSCRYCKTESSEEAIRLLIQAKTNVNIQNNDGYTALMFASMYCKTDSSEEAIRLLIEAKANVNIQNKKGWTALMFACRHCNTTSSEKAIRILLSKGANVDLQTEDGWTTLMIVLNYSNDINIIKLIEEKCKDIIIPEIIMDNKLKLKLQDIKIKRLEQENNQLRKIKKIFTIVDIMKSKVLKYI